MLTGARRGFTLIEIVVGTAIVVVLGAVTLATLTASRSVARARESYDILRDLNSRIHLYDSLNGTISADRTLKSPITGRYPQMISHLIIPIADASTSADGCLNCLTSCGLNKTGTNRTIYGYTSVHKTAWDVKGPFYDRNVIVSRGFPISIGLLRDSLVRTPTQSSSSATSTEAGTLQIQVDGVLEDDAIELKRMVDGQITDATQGTIRWTGAVDAGGRRTIYWASRVRGC